MPESFTPPSIVVGVDGSPDAARAALWAVDEALSRDIELRLVAVAKSASDDRAQQSLNTAAEAVRSAGRAVRIQTAILAGAPIPALLEQSQAAAMICVGALGLTHIGHSQAGSIDHVRVGSTAGALVASAHCPVAVVRSSGRPAGADPGWVTVEVDETPDSGTVLQFGVEEARLRGAPLRVLGAWQSRFTDVHDDHAVAEGNRMVRAQLDRRLSEWKSRYPDLDVRPVAVHGSMLNYLERNATNIQLIVVGARNAVGVGELLGQTGLPALSDTDCSVLVVDRQRLL